MGGVVSRSFQNDGSILTARLLSAAGSDNATLVLARRVLVRTIIGYNAAAAARYLKIYDKATAPASTDTPILTFYLPASTAFAFDLVHETAVGLGYRLVTGSADNDANAVTAADILGLNIMYTT
jgi:hypothetical protein